MESINPLQSFIEAYNDAWNRHDVEAILAMHTPDSVFHNHTSGGEVVGCEAIRSVVTGVFETFPDILFTLRRLYLRDDLVVQEWTATATHDRAVTYNGRVLQPTGKKISWDGVDVLPMRDGLVLRKDVYTDAVSFLRQLGAVDI